MVTASSVRRSAALRMTWDGEEITMIWLSVADRTPAPQHAAAGTMNPVPTPPPPSTKNSLAHKLADRARARWPDLKTVTVTHRGHFAYVTGIAADGEQLPLCRLRYGGSASQWGFAIYRASHDDYQDALLPTGLTIGTPEQALDTACGLYLNDPSAWSTPPTN